MPPTDLAGPLVAPKVVPAKADVAKSEVPARTAGRPREAATEDAIVDAALSLLDEQCYSEITIEKIASRAGVGKPTIYRRWRTKADIVLHAYAVRAANRTPPYVPTEDVFQDLQGSLERLFAVTTHPVNNRAVRCFIAESQYDEEFRKKFYDNFLAKRREAIAVILRHGQAMGQIRPDLDLVVACDLIYGAFSARLIHSAYPLDTAFAAAIVDHLRGGFEMKRK
jgi:AcrR family transcriptional regulator